MKNTSRRKFLGSAAAAAGAVSLGTFSGCGTRNPASDTSDSSKGSGLRKPRAHPLDGIKREDIKITDVRVTLLSYELPEEEQLRVVKGIWWKTDAVIVEVFTDRGIVGLGGATRYCGDCEFRKKYIEEFVKPVIIGQNPFDLQLLTCGGATQNQRGAWAGVDAALWDIVGKAVNVTVYKLLATDNDQNPYIR